MKRRYILAPQAARDLVEIWRYLRKESSEETADRVDSVIRENSPSWRILRAEGICEAISPAPSYGLSRSIPT